MLGNFILVQYYHEPGTGKIFRSLTSVKKYLIEEPGNFLTEEPNNGKNVSSDMMLKSTINVKTILRELHITTDCNNLQFCSYVLL